MSTISSVAKPVDPQKLTGLPVHARAPGKLYIAGEYAVVEPGHQAILIAVDKYLRVSLMPPRNYHRVPENQQLEAKKRVARGQLITHKHLTRARKALKVRHDYGTAAFIVMDKLRSERGLAPINFEIHVHNELRSSNGDKFGLGSSAAMVVGVIAAMGELYDLQLSPWQIFQLGLLASIEISASSSGGDLASAAFGGWVAYRSPDRSVLPKVIGQDLSVESALDHPEWANAVIEQLPVPAGLDVLVGWTGKPASTDSLVAQVKAGGERTRATYQDFLVQNQLAVAQLKTGMAENEVPAVYAAVTRIRELLGRLDEATGVVIETPLLKTLCDTAEEILGAEGAAKSSGAGGGDCGIALVSAGVDRDRIFDSWQRAGVRPLRLGVSPVGASIEDGVGPKDIIR